MRKSGAPKKRAFQTPLGQKIFAVAIEGLHPHHTSYKARLKRMERAISFKLFADGVKS